MKPKIFMPFYSMYGHTFSLMEAAAQGVIEAGGEPVLKRVAELVPAEFWNDKMKVFQEKINSIPVADPREDFKDINGIIMGTPTRFGNMCAQMRNFWDQTGGDWMKGTLINKPAAIITSTATQHGGQETTIISSMITLLHHGCVIVGLPYSVKEQMKMDEIIGGSPYGVSTIAGLDGERMPSETELSMARELGKRATEIAKKLR
ncbi:TPA: NAD(P)H:quinone oxidoreductase [Candidatus Dependentiae bacterium]|nr:NAD(P)H:quinone oxidoreductase [Candidatus Dependentiae bacterium]HCU00137.1 NAD(P)H:quinone oxidoreductase [Candidatus Dependentiae bacterium]